MMKTRTLITSVTLLLVAGTFHGASGDSSLQASRCSSASGHDATRACREYAGSNAVGLGELLQLGGHLEDAQKYAAAMALYQTGLHYNPEHPELLRRMVRVRSERRIRGQIGLLRPDSEYAALSTRVAAQLEIIRCSYLKQWPGCEDDDAATVSAASPGTLADPKNGASGAAVSAPPAQATAFDRQHGSLNNVDQVIRHSLSRTAEPSQSGRLSPAALKLSNFHALVVGNNRYRKFPRLETAVTDAKAVSALLKDEYGFQVTTLLNVDRYALFKELSRLRNTLGEADNLLIYYAGHGYLDEEIQRGYWLPIDAEEDNYANWLSTSDITDMVHGTSSLRVLVIADSCYSGTLARGALTLPGLADRQQMALIERIAEKRSRTVLTSGGLEPVLDSGRGKHSVFAQAFLDTLKENRGIIEASRVFSLLRRKVILNADQTPEYADIRKAGHEGGDFIFVKSSVSSARPTIEHSESASSDFTPTTFPPRSK